MSLNFRRLSALVAFLACFALSRAALAAGTYKFCFFWNYSFIDQGMGEDKLLHLAPPYGDGTYGVKGAAYSYAVVFRDSVPIWGGLLDVNGCTPKVPATAGTYEIYTTTDIEPPGGPKILITPTEAREWRWYWAYFGYLPSSTYQWTYSAGFGPGDALINVAAAALELLERPDNGLVNGQEYWVSAESTGLTGTGDAVGLGWNKQFSQWDAYFKSIIVHELGHLIQAKSFGFQGTPYDLTDDPMYAAPPICTCASVYDEAERSHCIQSREATSVAQVEGFAHFVATATLNSPAQSPAWFPYYKNFLSTDGNVYQPPMGFATVPWHWLRDQCPAGNGGVELDWMTFFYALTRNASASQYSFNDIAVTYRRTCTGSNTTNCVKESVTPWAGLVAAATAIHGTTKGVYWANQGDVYGVNY
ncbi:MAG: hypothetical protein ACOY0T_37570 [Myxococcota bacterium]